VGNGERELKIIIKNAGGEQMNDFFWYQLTQVGLAK